MQKALQRRPRRPGEKPRRGGAIALWALLILRLAWALFHLPDIGRAFTEFGAYLQYKFIRRALAVGVLVTRIARKSGV